MDAEGRTKEIWGERTPFAPGQTWPKRVDQHLIVPEAEVERWVQSACVLCSNGCGVDIAPGLCARLDKRSARALPDLRHRVDARDGCGEHHGEAHGGGDLRHGRAEFLLVAVYELSGDKGWEDSAGVISIGLAGLAVYTAIGSELEDALRRALLPLGRRGEAKQAVSADTLVEQVQHVQTEPGVRPKL